MLKKYSRYFIYELVVLVTYLIAFGYKIKNRHHPKILIYTDSRGFEITKLLHRRNPFSSYIGYFIKHYNVDYYITPKKHTTTLDFLDLYEQKKRNKYDYVILHTGIVDFSPRPLSMLQQIYWKKRKLYHRYFDEESIQQHLDNHYAEQYEGEYTNSIYSLDMAVQGVLPRLQSIENLIWIGCNRVLNDWQGNYPKKRPVNMYITEEYNRLFLDALPRCVDISMWSDEEIKKYTCDNIHFTPAGMAYLQAKVMEYLA